MVKMHQALIGILVLTSTSFVHPEVESLLNHGAQFDGTNTEARTSNQLNGENLQFDGISTSSVTTTTTTAEHPDIEPTHYLHIQVPPSTSGVNIEESALISGSESILGLSTSGIAEDPIPFVRPIGELPVPPIRFGFDNPKPHGPHEMPNCGCVPRGGCLGEVGIYTELVLPFTDIICGNTFQTCCFDGPWPGTYDSFGVAAACVPREECLRPYGVLPTDIRDYGVIAPCPGQGAVRCLMVDDDALLVFQAALAAIHAANIHHSHQIQSQPFHVVVPIAGGSAHTATTTVVENAASSSIASSGGSGEYNIQPAFQVGNVKPLPVVGVSSPPSTATNGVIEPALVEPNVVVQQSPAPNVAVQQPPSPTVVVQPQIPPQPNTVVQPIVPVKPNVIAPLPQAQPDIVIQTPAYPHPNIIVQPAPPVKPNIIFKTPYLPQPDIIVQAPPATSPNIILQAPPTLTATPQIVPSPSLAPPRPVHSPYPYPPIPNYPLYGHHFLPGYGFGKGFSIRKRIEFTKGAGIFG